MTFKLNRQIYESVIGINVYNKEENTLDTIGTGILFKFKKQTFFATNKHVMNNLSNFFITFFDANYKDRSRQIHITSINDILVQREYHKNPEVDICVFRISNSLLSNIQLDYINLEDYGLTVQEMLKKEIFETTEVILTGHPISLSANFGLHPIVRLGSISQISYMYDRNFIYKHFLIDAFAYPGNSGGPVIAILPEISQGKVVYKNYLIGIIQSYVFYKDEKNNTGLSSVIAFEHVIQCIEQFQ
jgi:hypothetical protein